MVYAAGAFLCLQNVKRAFEGKIMAKVFAGLQHYSYLSEVKSDIDAGLLIDRPVLQYA
jgi:hypothetical protein